MPNRKPPATDKALIRAITESFNEIELDSPEEINAILREAGYDPDQVGAQVKAIAERALRESPLNWRERASQEMGTEKARLAAFSSSIVHSRMELLDAIRQLVAKLGGETSNLAMAHFRNFESASDEDLASLLRELEYLEAQKRGDINTNKD